MSKEGLRRSRLIKQAKVALSKMSLNERVRLFTGRDIVSSDPISCFDDTIECYLFSEDWEKNVEPFINRVLGKSKK
jgi:hypothetical protein